jgi:transposase-like protein
VLASELRAVSTGQRRFSADRKLAVVAETMQPGMSINSVAHHYPSLVFRSRWPRSDALNVRFPAMRNPA